MAYVEIPKRIEQLVRHDAPSPFHATSQVLCGTGDTWQQIDRFPPGVTMAGTSIAAYLIGATHHSTIGAGYHRNDVGNMAMYRFFLSAPARSAQIARAWKVDYVAFCPGDFSEIHVTRTYPGSLAAQLERGQAPPWLQSMPLRGTPMRCYRVIH
jgi:hypothetical protein